MVQGHPSGARQDPHAAVLSMGRDSRAEPSVRTGSWRTIRNMTKALANFAELAATVSIPLGVDVIEMGWNTGDHEVLRLLAKRAELPSHLHRDAALHERCEVRASYASNPAANPDLLSLLADVAGGNTSIVMALANNPKTPEPSLSTILATGGRDIALLVLQRTDAPLPLRAQAAARLAVTTDATTARASRQLSGLLGNEPSIHVAALRVAPAHALGFVAAAVDTCGSNPDVQSALVDWVDSHGKNLVRGDYAELQSILVKFGSSSTDSIQLRTWVLGHLHAWKDRVLVEAMICQQSGELATVVTRRSTVSTGFEYISHLSGRFDDTYLSALVADAITTLVGSGDTEFTSAETHIRKIYNPVLGATMRELEVRGDHEALLLLARLAGVRHLDSLVNPWPVITQLEGQHREIAALEVARQNPRRLLDTLRPTEVYLRLGSEYMEAALAAFAELGAGTAAWHTAAVLAPSWQGNLDELLLAARTLSSDR